jgi:hypothetical protein
MKTLFQALLLALGALALAGTAYAQVPTSNDKSTADGDQNTGGGTGALLGLQNGNGIKNTAYGYSALADNSFGSQNTAGGASALGINTNGSLNAAYGYSALGANTFGNDNTAAGANALGANTVGNNNSALGYQALFSNQTGSDNTASGFLALFTNKNGSQNAAYGENALYTATASFNTAVGYDSLYKNKSGRYNVGLGWKAGFALTTGDNNIDIDNQGEAGDSDTIRIGTEGTQTTTYIAGITNGTSVSGPYVVIDSTTGQLGVSSVAPPGANVKTAYMTRLQKQVQRQAADIRDLKQQQLRTLQQVKDLNTLKQQVAVMSAALQKLQAKDELVAQR